MDNKCFHIKGVVLIDKHLHNAVALVKYAFVALAVGFEVVFNFLKWLFFRKAFFGFETVGK